MSLSTQEDAGTKFWRMPEMVEKLLEYLDEISILSIVSSVRSSSVHHGLLQATFSNFSNSSDSKGKVKVKGPNMCYIFEKHGIQGYQI